MAYILKAFPRFGFAMECLRDARYRRGAGRELEEFILSLEFVQLLDDVVSEGAHLFALLKGCKSPH